MFREGQAVVVGDDLRCVGRADEQQRRRGMGSGTVTVTADAGCAWTAGSDAAWVTISSGASGSSNGTVGYSVAANTASSGRSTSLTIAGRTLG